MFRRFLKKERKNDKHNFCFLCIKIIKTGQLKSQSASKEHLLSVNYEKFPQNYNNNKNIYLSKDRYRVIQNLSFKFCGEIGNVPGNQFHIGKYVHKHYLHEKNGQVK